MLSLPAIIWEKTPLETALLIQRRIQRKAVHRVMNLGEWIFHLTRLTEQGQDLHEFTMAWNNSCRARESTAEMLEGRRAKTINAWTKQRVCLLHVSGPYRSRKSLTSDIPFCACNLGQRD